jgi:putative ABC transport system substrate-binding protein
VIGFKPRVRRGPLGGTVRRRNFIKAIAGSAVTWPFALRAQQGERVRRVGFLIARTAADAEAAEEVAAFAQGLEELGWTIGRNVRIEYRYAGGDAATIHKYGVELAALAPEVVLAAGTPSVAALQQSSRSLPIVFTVVSDPVGAGFVDSLAKPGGNITGFMLAEYSLNAKLLELLKQIEPGVMRAAVLRDSLNPAGMAQFGAIQAVASSLGIEVSAINVRDAGEIEQAVAAFARSAKVGLVVTGSASATNHRQLIIALAAQQKLPAVYASRANVVLGGLLSYGPNRVEQFRSAAGYVDRILKGEKPAELPVQAPTSYELVINLKTAKALGLPVPPTLLASATRSCRCNGSRISGP